MSAALLFPGQGSQEPGMGRDLAEADRTVMELWKKAEQISGIALREIYWDKAGAEMTLTRNLQPALTVVNLALWMRLAPKMIPSATAGHSLGEYSALAAAGVLPVNTVLELVALRGRLMDETDPHGAGGMAAVLKLSQAQVEECAAFVRNSTGEMMLVANYNTPGQFVVSGTRTAIEKMQEAVRTAKGRMLPLAVSGAFHSPLMNQAAAEMAKALDGVRKSAWNKARFPVYCNAAPAPESDPQALKTLLAKQMTSPVLWIDTIICLWGNSCRVFVECGPKEVLGKMVTPILQAHAPAATEQDANAPAWQITSVRTMAQADQFAL